MALPSWLLPAGLAAGVVALLMSQRKPNPEANDIVGVSAGRLLSGAVPAVLPVTIPQGYKAAVQVTQVQGDQVTGTLYGWIDPPTGELVPLPGAVPGGGVGPLTFPTSAALDIFRGGKRIR